MSAWLRGITYRGRHRRRRNRVGHLTTGIVLFYAAYLR